VAFQRAANQPIRCRSMSNRQGLPCQLGDLEPDHCRPSLGELSAGRKPVDPRCMLESASVSDGDERWAS
jgi:hypothetical protein